MQAFRPARNCSLLTGICLMICWSESQQQGQASQGAGSAELCLVWPCLDLLEQPDTSHQAGSKDMLEVPPTLVSRTPPNPLFSSSNRVLTIAHSWIESPVPTLIPGLVPMDVCSLQICPGLLAKGQEVFLLLPAPEAMSVRLLRTRTRMGLVMFPVSCAARGGRQSQFFCSESGTGEETATLKYPDPW